MKNISRYCASIVLSLSLVGTYSYAHGMNLEIDQAKSVRLNTAATGIVVGNSGIADVIVHEPKVLLFIGKSVGRTNVLVVGKDGKTIYSGNINVSASEEENSLTIQRGTDLQTNICKTRCVPVGQPEASSVPLSDSLNRAKLRSGFAGGGN